ncbi:LysR family transcriptional regulator [uncultured Eubacterium sp.]|uniref:LysR family transcriptional regulator n=1 Tax=uncultured Eubacterium sp. TaxID=165185 RepID=UPI0025F06CE8|nr:LysR family transcriptional regulator [uncultured Eubacterium sp.]
MNEKDLKSFLTVYQENSISQAAKKLFITPQGLSKNIKNLEQELDTILFERTKNGVHATESAHILNEKAQRLILEYDEIKRAMQHNGLGQKTLRIGCANGILNLLPFSVLKEFMECYPDIQVEWAEYENEVVRDKLIKSEIEYGFVVGSWNEATVTVKKQYETNLVLLVYAGHELYQEKSICLEQLKNEKIILLNEKFHIFHNLVDACKARGFFPQIIAKTSDVSSQYKLCREGFGLAVVPEFVKNEFQMEHLHAVPFDEKIKWEVYSCYKTSMKDYSAVKLFHEYLNRE